MAPLSASGYTRKGRFFAVGASIRFHKKASPSICRHFIAERPCRCFFDAENRMDVRKAAAPH
jgi:hypothetical protein